MKRFERVPTAKKFYGVFQRKLAGVSHNALICLIGVVLLSESVIAMPSKIGVQIAQQQVSTEQDVSTAAQKAFNEGYILYQQGTKESQQQARVKFQAALKLYQQIGNKQMEAATLNSIGEAYSALGDREQALRYFNQALPLYEIIGNRLGEAATFGNVGYVYLRSGDLQQALTYFNKALTVYQALEDRSQESRTLDIIGQVYGALGDREQAQRYWNRSLTVLSAVSDRNTSVSTFNTIGATYGRLGDLQQELTYYKRALTLTVGNRFQEADTLTNIGGVYGRLGEWQQALIYFKQALPLFHAVGDRFREVATLTNIALAYSYLGDLQQTLTYYNQALPRWRGRAGEAGILNNIGSTYQQLGEWQQAMTYYKQALTLYRVFGDRGAEVVNLYSMTAVERTQGNLPAALTNLDAIIQIVEDFRTKIVSPELRASYFATQQDAYEFKIDVLMLLHKQNPSMGYNTQALETTDRAHARALVELLTEAGGDIREGIKPELLKREQALNQTLNALEKQRLELANRQSTEQQLVNLNQKIAQVLQDEQQLRTEIRSNSPRYAALKFPQPLTLKQIQQQVLNDDTVLLAYSLGTESSYLWLVSKTEVQSYNLPKRSEIEAQAKQFYDLKKTNPTDSTDPNNYPSQAAKNRQIGINLSKMILQPIASKLGKKRLLVVGDGILQYIPFAALPLCKDDACNNPMPLVTQHEIVNAPSISTIATLRSDKRNRTPIKTLAVIADPVFTLNDPRFTDLNRQANLTPSAPKLSNNQEQQLVQRSARESGVTFKRLSGTRKEAQSILALVPSVDRIEKFDFDANRTFAMSPELGKYRFVLFATHGMFNDTTPELSGLVLSLIDKKGQPDNGFLRLNDIFNLKLSADLVVLSACQTGLGKDVKGEGLVGLTRGFMYAGSPRVVVSLWKVSDDVTSVLMTKFYANMLNKKLKPAEALRTAQLEMLKNREYSDPYYWAGFTLQGEWR
jgi:CHAT domain-containing protein/Tfp pilus assembly protein PilF